MDFILAVPCYNKDMKKKQLSSYYIIFFLFLQVFGGLIGASAYADEEKQAVGITDEQRSVIINHCDTIKDNLKSLQRTDSRARVYLGRYYETILTDFITPLNLRLVENNITNTALLENQTNFAARRTRFSNDYIAYQQALEELVNVNCKSEPEKFYEKLVLTREKRQMVNRDTKKMRELAAEQVRLVEELRNATK